ncbi:uncharacterized protein LOC135814654 [Sycon ciliatum]|uniref:uncharacterized protein LOC135814654 n=1 Tax=Sycon ciliatum TaxID=27933 RepID=UPI0020ACDCC2|eukprot:scpid42331/ scgid16227/ 
MSHTQLSSAASKLVRLLQTSTGRQAVCKPTQYLKNTVQQYTMLESSAAIQDATRTCLAYSTMLDAVKEQQELDEKYGKGEQSIKASAHRVGLELPKAYEESAPSDASANNTSDSSSSKTGET